jgi:hypothetical protein
MAIEEGRIWQMESKKRKTDAEKLQLALLLDYTPDTLSDTGILSGIEKLGFVKQEVPRTKFGELDRIFCERKHKDPIALSCIAIYRDILVFRKNGRITGTTKICFGCLQHVIAGTTRNTSEFGQSGDYNKLKFLLHLNAQY